MNKVLIKIKAQQEVQGSEPEDFLDLLTAGKHYNKDGVVYLMYEETELSGIPGCVTSLKLDGEVLSMRRYGIAAQELRFEKGQRWLGLYETPLGTMDMEIYTNDLTADLKYGGAVGSITVDYNINLKGLVEAHNILNIRVAKIPPRRKNTQ